MLLAIAVALAPAPVSADAAAMLEAKVIHVDDGDTIDVRVEGRIERVRYIGIDAPEVPHGGVGGERGGEAAARLNVALVGGKRVRLEMDREARDRYGRLLAYVWVGDTMANLEMVRRGYAQTLTIPPNARYEEWFARAEAVAQAARLGLWGDADLAGPTVGGSRRWPGGWRTSRHLLARSPTTDARSGSRCWTCVSRVRVPRDGARRRQRSACRRHALVDDRAGSPVVRPILSRSWAAGPSRRTGATPASCPGCLWEGR